jgi:hypothetical protein
VQPGNTTGPFDGDDDVQQEFVQHGQRGCSGVSIATRSRSETGAATVPGPTRTAVHCRRRTRHVQGILYFRRSADGVDNPGGRRPCSGPLRSRSGNPVYWHEGGGGGASLGFRVSFRLRLVGMRGAAADDHEGEPRPHWPRALWLNTRHVADGRAWVCRFDLHGWSTSDMNVQVRAGDGLVAPYRQRHAGGVPDRSIIRAVCVSRMVSPSNGAAKGSCQLR